MTHDDESKFPSPAFPVSMGSSTYSGLSTQEYCVIKLIASLFSKGIDVVNIDGAQQDEIIKKCYDWAEKIIEIQKERHSNKKIFANIPTEDGKVIYTIYENKSYKKVSFNEEHYYNKYNQLHRKDGPAVIEADGARKWYLNGELHREDGPATEWPSGTKEWWHHGKLHRKDGPAIETLYEENSWYFNGELHRENGPAVEYSDGHKEWWLNGKRIK